MTSANISIGRQLLVAIISNNEAEFIRILDAACLHIRRNQFDTATEIDRVRDQIREAEIVLGLAYDPASWKTVRSEMRERLSSKNAVLLAA